MTLMLRPQAEKAALPTRLRALGLARRRAVVCGGVFRFLAVLLVSVAVLGTADAIWNLPSFARACGLVATLVVGGVFFLRGVLLAAREPVNPLAIAHELERRFPRLNDSLASAVEFLVAAEDHRQGSPRLRRIAILRAENILSRHSVEKVVPRKQAWRGFWLFMLAFLFAAPLALSNTPRTQRVVSRLALPYGSTVLPTRTKLTLMQPNQFPIRIAKGEAFDIRFSLEGVFPEQVLLEVRLHDGVEFEEAIPVVPPAGGAVRKIVMEAHLDAGRIPRDFSFRLRANDAETEWIPVEVAPPPRLVPRDGRHSPQLSLDFPAYTELASLDLPDGAAAIEAAAGTRIRFRAAADRRIVSAALRPQAVLEPYRLAAGAAATAGTSPLGVLGSQQLADQFVADIPVRISGRDGTLLDAEFVPIIPGLHTLRFTDETGLTGTRLLELQILADPAPVVSLDRPAPGTDSLTLLPTAAIPLQVRAEDRMYAVRSLFLEYRVGGVDTPWQSLPLLNAPRHNEGVAALASGTVFAARQPVAVAASQTLPLNRLPKPDGTTPADGDLVTIRAAADDWDTVSVLKEPGRSKEIDIRVVSSASLDVILQQELARLRPELLRVREQLRAAREGVAESGRAAADGKPTADSLDKLRTAEQTQRDVRNKVADPRDGLRAAAEQLRAAVRANSLPKTTTTDRVDAVASDLAKLAEQQLDPADQHLTAAREQLERIPPAAGSPEAKKLADTLARTASHQQAAEKSIDAILRHLEQWGGPSEVRAEARTLKEQLARSNDHADKTTAKIPPGKSADKLPAAEAAELARASEKYTQLAEQAAGTLAKAEQLAQEKEKQAADLLKTAATKSAAAAEAAAAAKQLPAGSPAAQEQQAKAAALAAEASTAQAAAKQAQAEAAALRKAIAQAGGQELVDRLRTAGSELKNNNTARSSEARQDAAKRIDQLSQALTEQPRSAKEELAKKQAAIQSIDELASEQDELRKKVKQAKQIPDLKKRAEELEKLANEQANLREKVEAQAEKLSRESQTREAAEQLRRAAEKMEAAQADIEQGRPSDTRQADALDKLDEAAERLDRERKDRTEQLSREKRTELAASLTVLRDRLKAADVEAARLQADVARAQAWDRARLASLRDLSDRTTAIADELRVLSDKQLEPLPVFRQLVDQAAVLTRRAASLFAERKDSAADDAGNPFDLQAEIASDDRTRRPLRTALRRLDHVLAALKEEPKPKGEAAPQEAMPPPPDMPPRPPDEARPEANGVPPLAQLRALRSIQAEVNERTAAFARAHPDKAAHSPADRDELEELERTQREVAELIRTIAPTLRPMAGPTNGPELP